MTVLGVTFPGVGSVADDRRGTLILIASLLILLISLGVMSVTPEKSEFPPSVTDQVHFTDWVNDGEDWLRKNYRWFTRAIAGAIGGVLEQVEIFLLSQSWPIILLMIVLPALAYGGVRLGLLCLVCALFWGFMDMWDPAMTTLSLMAVSVFLSVVFGVSIGVAASQSDRVEAVVRPVLDTMQTMPAFVYLIPAILFFGIGGPPAVMATVIYALPPAVRLTNLGLRQVPAETLEAARSFGSTRLQTLIKVQFPMALPSIMMGVNQTIMMALGLVVLATFIGAGGLGYEVLQALRHLNVGWSLEGGLSIVFMAIIFDRLSHAMSGQDREVGGSQKIEGFRLLPRVLDENRAAQGFERVLAATCEACNSACRGFSDLLAQAAEALVGLVNKDSGQSLAAYIRQHLYLFAGIALIWFLMLVNEHLWSFGSFPSSWHFEFREPVDAAVDWLTVNKTFIACTTWIRTVIFVYMLKPLADFLVGLPWWYVIALVGLGIWFSAGRGLAVFCLLSLLFVGAVGLWPIAMFTLALILVSVLLCALIGVPIGILAAYSNAFDAFLKPVLDAMQTLPAFVYLIPVIMFFGGGQVSAVIATLIYAIPPMIRLTTLGIRQVPQASDEVARSFGSTLLQTLAKVKLPLALPSIMMGLNQAVMMALAMTVITPLIGGGGLGKEVYHALNVANTGRGLQAGLSIVLLAIVLDRLSQAWSRNRQLALGVQ